MRNAGGGSGSSTEPRVKPGSWRTYGVGIDTHSKFVSVTVLIPVYAEQIEKRFNCHFSTAFSDLRKGGEWVRCLLRSHGIVVDDANPLHYTIESTAVYHYPICRLWGGRFSVVNPNLIRAGSRKTDDIDSLSLAEMDLARRWPISYWFPDDQMAVRVLLRLWHRHARLSKLWTNSLNSQLLKFGVVLSRLGSIRSPEIRPQVEDVLARRRLMTPEGIDSVLDPNLPDCLLEPLSRMYDWADEAEERAKLLWKAMERQLRLTRYNLGGEMVPGTQARERLATIPGIGDQTATWLLAEIGEISRFPTATALGAWCGCDLSLRESAGKVTSFTRRKGHRHIHWLLVQAAQTALRGKDGLAKWGQKRIAKGGKGAKQRAVGAVARRIAEGVFHVLLTGQPWKQSPYLEALTCVEQEGEGGPGTASSGSDRPTGETRCTGARGDAGTDGGGRTAPEHDGSPRRAGQTRRAGRQGGGAGPEAEVGR